MGQSCDSWLNTVGVKVFVAVIKVPLSRRPKLEPLKAGLLTSRNAQSMVRAQTVRFEPDLIEGAEYTFGKFSMSISPAGSIVGAALR
jgi:hypothetical protein